MLHCRTVVNLETFKRNVGKKQTRPAYLDRILPRCSNNLPAVKLQPGNGMIVLESFEYSAAAKIPNLARGAVS